MKMSLGQSTLSLLVGDITEQEVDAIVNAANEKLLVGGGVDGAIHRAGGQELNRYTSKHYPDGCPTGSAVASPAGRLPAQFVFHGVGPVWGGGFRNEEQQLRSVYRTCLDLAIDNDCRSLAFPAISCGIYGYPLDRAAAAAVSEVGDFLRSSPPLHVHFVLFSDGVYGAFQRAAEDWRNRED